MPPTPLIFLEISLSLSRLDKTLRAGRDHVSDGNKGVCVCGRREIKDVEEVEVVEKVEVVVKVACESPPQGRERTKQASKHSERTQ